MFSKLANHLDVAKNEIRNAILQVLGAAPAAPSLGQMYYDSALLGPRWFDGTGFSNKATDSTALSGQNAAFYLARANHTGTQSAATIGDLAATVKAYKLSEFGAAIANVDVGSNRIINQADPVNPQDSATKNYVDNQVSNAAAGIDSKASVRFTTAGANDTLTGLVARDGVTPVAGDRVLAPSQTTGAQNGVYIAAAGAWTRALDADATGEITTGATWFIEEGTLYGATTWRVGTTGSIVLGTTSISITQLAAAQNYTGSLGIQKVGNDFRAQVVAAGGVSAVAGGLQIDRTVVPFKAAATIGTGALLVIPFAHNLATTDVTVSVKEVATGEMVGCKVVVTDANTVTLTFGAAPAASSIRVVVTG